MEKISAVIVVKGNPPYLPRTIKSIQDMVNEIVIVDIGMDEKLKNDLLADKKIKIREIKEDVPYVELIRERTKAFASNDNVIFLDPDEVIPPALRDIIVKNIGRYDYMRIPRKNLIFGRWIKHSRWWPDYQIRAFKKNKIKWPTIIHRQPKVQGSEYEIEAKEENAILHYNYRDLDEYMAKATRYAKHEAKEFIEEKRILTFKETMRRALNEFISRYFQAEGYKDGTQGFILAFFQMFYYFLVYFYYLELNNFEQEKNIDTVEFFREGLRQTIHFKKNKTLKERLIKKLL